MNKLSRRELLLSIVGLLAMPSVGATSTCPDRERTAIIDQWLGIVGRTIVGLEQLQHFLRAARTVPPSRVDVVTFINTLDAAQDVASDFLGDIDNTNSYDADDLIRAITGLGVQDALDLAAEVEGVNV
jgi:hypothetical protein